MKCGVKLLSGRWMYSFDKDVFYIRLNSKDPVTGSYRYFQVTGEKPEFNGWKLVGAKVENKM